MKSKTTAGPNSAVGPGYHVREREFKLQGKQFPRYFCSGSLFSRHVDWATRYRTWSMPSNGDESLVSKISSTVGNIQFHSTKFSVYMLQTILGFSHYLNVNHFLGSKAWLRQNTTLTILHSIICTSPSTWVDSTNWILSRYTYWWSKTRLN